MRKNSGKYMFVGPASRFGAEMKFADSLSSLKLSKYDKQDIKEGNALLLAVDREGKITRINSNGHKR